MNVFFFLALVIDYAIYAAEIPPHRIALVSLPAAINLSIATLLIFRKSAGKMNLTKIVTLTSLLLISLSLYIRVFNVLIGKASNSQLFSSSHTQVFFFLSAGMATVAGSIGFILMSIEKLGQEIIEQTAQTQHASRLSAVGEMAGGIAHEVNNPLSIVQGNLEQLQRSLQQAGQMAEKYQEKFSRIFKAIERISRVIRALRAFTKQSENDPMISVPLVDIVSETLSLCQEKFSSEGVHMEVSDIPQIELHCQPVQISQVLMNLINNAYDAMKDNHIDNPYVKIDFALAFNRIKIMVCNPGKPLAESVKIRLFQPFYTTKEIGRGTGLGLSISKNIAMKHQGDITLQERDGLTIFVLELPLNAETV